MHYVICGGTFYRDYIFPPSLAQPIPLSTLYSHDPSKNVTHTHTHQAILIGEGEEEETKQNERRKKINKWRSRSRESCVSVPSVLTTTTNERTTTRSGLPDAVGPPRGYRRENALEESRGLYIHRGAVVLYYTPRIFAGTRELSTVRRGRSIGTPSAAHLFFHFIKK